MKKGTIEKHKRVIDEWLINGENGTKAYQSVYPNSTTNTAEKAFREIHGNPRIQKYVLDEKEKRAITTKEEHGITFLTQLNDQLAKKQLYAQLVKMAAKDKLDPLEEDKFKRLKDIVKLGDVNKADDMINKLLGFYEEHNKQRRSKETEKQVIIILSLIHI